MPSKAISPRSFYVPHTAVLKTFRLPSRAKQSFQEESEINNIMAKYQKTGMLGHVAKYGPRYADLPPQEDYHAAMNIVAGANTMFEELPSSIRYKFENDPAKFLEFCEDEENIDEMREMGILALVDIPDEPELDLKAPKGADEPEPPEEAPSAD